MILLPVDLIDELSIHRLLRHPCWEVATAATIAAIDRYLTFQLIEFRSQRHHALVVLQVRFPTAYGALGLILELFILDLRLIN
jgi:hypothetical protein